MRGKDCGSALAPAPFADHPRACGEKLDQTYTTFRTQWITPAYAGKSNEFSEERLG